MKCDAICFSDHAVIIAEDSGGKTKGRRVASVTLAFYSQELHHMLWKLNCPNFLWIRKWPNSKTQSRDLMHHCWKKKKKCASHFISIKIPWINVKIWVKTLHCLLLQGDIISCFECEDVEGRALCGWGPLSQHEEAALWEPGQYNSVYFAPWLPLFLSLSGSWQIVGGVNGKAPAPVPLVHHTNVKGTIHVTAVCCHGQSTLS